MQIDYDLFNTGTNTLSGCGGAVHTAEVTIQVPEIRKLTGMEQKKICKLARKSAGLQLGIGKNQNRCYIANQYVHPSTVIPVSSSISTNTYVSMFVEM